MKKELAELYIKAFHRIDPGTRKSDEEALLYLANAVPEIKEGGVEALKDVAIPFPDGETSMQIKEPRTLYVQGSPRWKREITKSAEQEPKGPINELCRFVYGSCPADPAVPVEEKPKRKTRKRRSAARNTETAE